MSSPDLSERIRRLMADVMHVEVASVDTDLIETGVLDSLALVELLFQVELHLGIRIPLDDVSVESFRTVRGIAEMVSDLAGARLGEAE